MKKTIGILATLAMLKLCSVAAMDEIDVECGRGWIGSICSEHELDQEFGQVTSYVSSHEAAWSIDQVGGGGIGSYGVRQILTGSFDYTHRYETYHEYAMAQVIEMLMDQQDYLRFHQTVQPW